MALTRWTQGQTAVTRFIWFGKVANAKPVIVVEDSDELIALYIAPGTRFKRAGTDDRRKDYLRDLAEQRWTLYDDVWRKYRTLVLTRPGSAHCILGFWPEDGGDLVGWYVNLEDPLRHSPVGFDGRDVFLDIIVRPDGSWRWKDEDEFEEAQRLGLLSPEETQAVRAEAQRVIDAVERGHPWWMRWKDWSPDPSWGIPALTEGWDVVAGGSAEQLST